jgi:hypothetical protein
MTITSQTVKNISVTALAVMLLIIAFPVARIAYRLDSFLTTDRLRNLENNVDATVSATQLNANKYGEIADSTTGSIDNHLNPAIDRIASRVDSGMRQLENRIAALAPLQDELTATVSEGRFLIADSNERINGNGGLLAEATSLIRNMNLLATKFGLSMDELNAAIKNTADKLGMSVDALTHLLADPNLPKIIENAEHGTADLAIMAANGRQATNELPQLFADIRKMSDHASKFQKFVTAARILGLIAPFLVAF